VVVNLKGKKYAKDALWKSQGRLDKETLFPQGLEKGTQRGNFFKVLELRFHLALAFSYIL
jgi:hypothetical protein